MSSTGHGSWADWLQYTAIRNMNVNEIVESVIDHGSRCSGSDEVESDKHLEHSLR